MASAPRQAATPASTAAWQEIARVPLHAQRQQDSVREAARTGRHPERLSLACSPTPFRWEAYRHDPMAYLDVIEPGRALAPADPGPDVPPLRRDGPEHVPTSHGQWTALRVHAAPRAPVSGASLDKGIFDNGLSAITVQCDDAGVAVLRYTATLGTEADVRIVAASPAASGLARWVLTVVAPAAPRSVAPAAR